MGKVARNARNDMQQEDAHKAQSSSMYKTVIRPVLMYENVIWALGMVEENLIKRTEMRMLRWLMEIKRIEKVRNEEIKAYGQVWAT